MDVVLDCVESFIVEGDCVNVILIPQTLQNLGQYSCAVKKFPQRATVEFRILQLILGLSLHFEIVVDGRDSEVV